MIQSHQEDATPGNGSAEVSEHLTGERAGDTPAGCVRHPGLRCGALTAQGAGRRSVLGLAVGFALGLAGCDSGSSPAVDVQGDGLAVRMEVAPPSASARALPTEQLALRVTLSGVEQAVSQSGTNFVTTFELPGTGQFDLLVEWLAAGQSVQQNNGIHLAVAGPLIIDANVRRDITLSQSDYRRLSRDIDTAAGRILDLDGDGIGNLDELRLASEGFDPRVQNDVTPNEGQTNCAELNGAPPQLPDYFDATAQFNNSGQDGFFVMAGRQNGPLTPRFSTNNLAAFVPLWVVETGELSLVHSQGGPDDTGAVLYQTESGGGFASEGDFEHTDARRASISVNIGPGVYCYRLEGRGADMTGSVVQVTFDPTNP